MNETQFLTDQINQTIQSRYNIDTNEFGEGSEMYLDEQEYFVQQLGQTMSIQ